jgi:AcrR family transcriptional regulator/DNA-binding MarR family transcriptional regulator
VRTVSAKPRRGVRQVVAYGRGGRAGLVGDARRLTSRGYDDAASTEMGEIQRARMLAGMVEVCAERGAANVTVAHIVARSGVSRRTFYAQFEDREECFLAAFDQAIERIGARVIPAFEGQAGWRDGVRAGLAALLGFLDGDPGSGRLCIVETLGAGDRALARRAGILEILIATIDQGHAETKAAETLPPLTAEGTVGAVLSVIHARLLERPVPPRVNGAGSNRAPRPLSELLNPLMGMIVLPYLGQAAARRELTRPVGRPRAIPDRAHLDPLRDLDMRLTYRTIRALVAIAATPDASNRQIAEVAGVGDQGQISKLLSRLSHLGLIQNTGPGHAHGERNAWTLTAKGHEIQQAIQAQTGR